MATEHRLHLQEPPGPARPGAPHLRRRDLRPVRATGPGHRRRAKLDPRRAAARLGVVTAMVVSTAAFAVAGRAEPAPPVAPATGLSAVQVLSAPSADAIPPESLRAVRDRPSIVGVGVGVELTSRIVERPSRGAVRPALPDCTGVVTDIGTNGRLPAAALCDLWQAPYQDRADAVVTLFALNDAYRAAFGRDMCLSSGYRDLEEQAALRARRGGLAAAPGTSNHGWGLAVDLCPSTYSGDAGTWLHEVGPVYGWANPAWAHRGGDGPYEPWHWEYTDAVTEIEARSGGR